MPSIDLSNINYEEFRIARKLIAQLYEMDKLHMNCLKRSIPMHLYNYISIYSNMISIKEKLSFEMGKTIPTYDMEINKENIVWSRVLEENIHINPEDTVHIISFNVKNNRLLTRIKETIKEYEQVKGMAPEETKIKLTTEVLFPNSDTAANFFKNKDIMKRCDLSQVDFDKKNISGLDISENIGNVFINIDKIQKDLSNSVVRGYNLSGKILSNFNLTDADLTKTNAGIDILSCTISSPTKLSSGTQFDEDNKFYLGEQEISVEEAKKLNLNIRKKN